MAILGIDAVNTVGGGGLTLLAELLRNAHPEEYGFHRVVVWGGSSLAQIDDPPWLEKRIVLGESDRYWKRISWASLHLTDEVRSAGCDLLFCPSGTFANGRVRYVSMVQNMLLYDAQERARFPWGWNRLRYNLLRQAQKKSIKNSCGVIYVSGYAKDTVQELFPFARKLASAIVYPGVSARFLETQPKPTPPPKSLRLLYVSRVNYYKHQWNVIEAVNRLNREGYRIELSLVGEGHSALESQMQNAIGENLKDAIRLKGNIPYSEIEQEYHSSDAFIFASTCESISIILLEAMCAGLPIACSDYSAMPEVLGPEGLYFDPLRVDSIVAAIQKLADDETLRNRLAVHSRKRAEEFSWEKSATNTFLFLESCLSK